MSYVLLGIIQGLTEFLPVSSSGHLALLHRFLGMNQEVISLSVVLHLGTVCAMLLFFRRDLLALRNDRVLLGQVALVTVITGVVGLGGKSFFEGLFNSPRAVGAGWLVTACVLGLTARVSGGERLRMSLRDAFILGGAQAAAIMPGVSRSGITIATLLFLRLQRDRAFRLSFLAGIPAIIGAAVLEAPEIDAAARTHLFEYAAGFCASLASGLAALWLLRLIMNKAKLHYFGVYCAVAALLTFIFVR